MKDLFKSLPEVKKKLLPADGCVLMLDFDGTLSPLAETPDQALLPKDAKEILKKMSRRIPTAIVSGRSLADIRRRDGISGIIYVGNHGLEWQIGATRDTVKIPAAMVRALTATGARLNDLKERYPGVIVEDKGMTWSLHYRLVPQHRVKRILFELRAITKQFRKWHLLKIVEGKKVFEVRPDMHWNKGHWATFFYHTFGRRSIPIYIGDDFTDEDAFKMLKKGITVNVGKSKGSKAAYFCRTTKQVAEFLNWLGAVA